MTHEELLATIDHMWSDNFDYVIEQNRKALRAVVELHKPTKNKDGWCVECCLMQNHYIVYPCPTIQAIEKELK